MHAYSAGVNAAAESARARPVELQVLRIEFEPWRPADTLTVTKLLALGLSTNWERELLRADMTRELGPELAARLDPGYPVGNPVALEPGAPWSGDGLGVAEQIAALRESLGFAAEATGSNNWAVGPSRSATGGALMAGDPHLSPSMPGITYQLGLYLDDRFCRGASFPGRLGIAFGQNNDVAWSFTNAMADVMDLFVERIDGATYEFERERRPLEVYDEEIKVRGRAEAVRLEVRRTHHGPIVNEALRADPSEPLALAWTALGAPCVTEATLGVLDVSTGSELVDSVAPHNAPVSNLVWADRHGSIGYKTIGLVPIRRGGCPDLPKPGWTGEYEWEGTVPYDELPELVDPDRGYVLTANNRITPEDYPHHLTSDWLDGYRARRIEDVLAASDEHDLDTFAGLQTDLLSLPGLETARRLSRLRPRDQRETAAIEHLRSWDGVMDADSIAATIYQAFTLRFARELAREVIGDRDLCERWLDRAHNGFMAHVTAPWRWQSHLLELWAEADPELISRPWEELALDSLRGALDELSRRFGSRFVGVALGTRPRGRVPAPARRREPDPGADLQSPDRARRWPGDRCPGRLGSIGPVQGDLGARLANGGRSARSRPLTLAGVQRPVRPRREPSLRRPPAALARRPAPADGRRGAVADPQPRARRCLVSPSRRHQITLTDDERTELLDSERVVVVSSLGPRGWPHSMPIWYVVRDGDIWVWTYAKSQKVKNLERDPRATLLVETGFEYTELRGIQIEANAELIRDVERSSSSPRSSPSATPRGSSRSRATPRTRSGPRPRSASRSTSSPCAWRPGTTENSAGRTETLCWHVRSEDSASPAER